MNLTVGGFHIHGDVMMLGLVTGMLYGILAVGLVLIYRSSRIINFAYGDVGAFGAALLFVAVRKWGTPYWIAFGVALAVSAGIGSLSEVVIMRRLRNAPLVLSVIATLGLGQVLLILSTLVATVGGHGIGLGAQSTFPLPAGFPHFFIGALLVTPAYSAMLILTPFVVLALVLFLRRGRLGIAIRASADNPDAARMAGMAAGRLSALTWGIAGAVACYTAVLVLPARGFTSSELLGPDLLLRGLLCAVVASMVSMPIALASGLVLGVIEQLLLANYPSGGLVEMVLFVLIVGVLLLQRSTSGRAADKGTWSAVQAFGPLPRSYLKIRAVRRLGWRIAAGATVAALVVPELLSNRNATILALIAVIAIVGISVTLVTGLAGQLSLGQFGIAAVGAAGAYQAQHHGAPFLVAVVVAAATGAAVSLVIGIPAIRIRGLMLAVATLSFALACDGWLLQQPWTFGSGVVTRRPKLFGFAFNTGKRYYLVALAILLVATWLTRNAWKGGVGRRLRAVRDNEEAARAFGIPATTVKLQAFVLSGVIAGLGGAVYFALLSQQGPVAYPIDLSTNAVAASVIGGLGLMMGPILGALYLIGVPQWLPLDNAGLLATAAVWLVLLLVAPGGLGQLFLARIRDRMVDRLAERAGLDPEVERNITPGGGVFAAAGAVELAARGARHVAGGEVLLRAEGLTKRFGGLTAVDDVTVEVRAGEILGLIGPNGAGKTTFFEILGGFTRPDAGTITFEGGDVTRLRPEQRADRGLIRSFQDAALFPTMTVHEVLMVALERSEPTGFVKAITGLSGASDRRKEQKADDLLAVLGLLSYRDLKIAELSTGTRRITELACLIALEPLLLLLDEPTSGIAQRETEALGEVLRTIKRQLDLTMVVIEHDIPLIMGLADRIAAMDTGEIVTVGTPAEVQADARVVASYLGTDVRSIERSTRTPVDGASRSAQPRCAAMIRNDTPCTRPAGPDGFCAQHRPVLSEP